MPHISKDAGSKDTMLLTVILPPSVKPAPQFYAAMLCFPQGTPQRILNQLKNKSVLQSLTDCLEDGGEGLEGLMGRMAEDGCPDVEIFPMETVGYYDLTTCGSEN